jgi:hypothetical protein
VLVCVSVGVDVGPATYTGPSYGVSVAVGNGVDVEVGKLHSIKTTEQGVLEGVRVLGMGVGFSFPPLALSCVVVVFGAVEGHSGSEYENPQTDACPLGSIYRNGLLYAYVYRLKSCGFAGFGTTVSALRNRLI